MLSYYFYKLWISNRNPEMYHSIHINQIVRSVSFLSWLRFWTTSDTRCRSALSRKRKHTRQFARCWRIRLHSTQNPVNCARYHVLVQQWHKWRDSKWSWHYPLHQWHSNPENCSAECCCTCHVPRHPRGKRPRTHHLTIQCRIAMHSFLHGNNRQQTDITWTEMSTGDPWFRSGFNAATIRVILVPSVCGYSPVIDYLPNTLQSIPLDEIKKR